MIKIDLEHFAFKMSEDSEKDREKMNDVFFEIYGSRPRTGDQFDNIASDLWQRQKRAFELGWHNCRSYQFALKRANKS